MQVSALRKRRGAGDQSSRFGIFHVRAREIGRAGDPRGPTPRNLGAATNQRTVGSNPAGRARQAGGQVDRSDPLFTSGCRRVASTRRCTRGFTPMCGGRGPISTPKLVTVTPCPRAGSAKRRRSRSASIGSARARQTRSSACVECSAGTPARYRSSVRSNRLSD